METTTQAGWREAGLMANGDSIPTRDEVRRILAAAADVIFSDGVHKALLDQWADETMIMLSVTESSRVTGTRQRSS